MVVFDSILINILGSLPIVFFALFVVDWGTEFWTAFWNLFAVGVAGFALLLAPATIQPIGFFVETLFIPWWTILIVYSVVAAVLGFKIDSDIIRGLGDSRVISGILLTTLVAQIFLIRALDLLLISAAIVTATIFILRWFIHRE